MHTCTLTFIATLAFALLPTLGQAEDAPQPPPAEQAPPPPDRNPLRPPLPDRNPAREKAVAPADDTMLLCHTIEGMGAFLEASLAKEALEFDELIAIANEKTTFQNCALERAIVLVFPHDIEPWTSEGGASVREVRIIASYMKSRSEWLVHLPPIKAYALVFLGESGREAMKQKSPPSR